MSIIPIPSSRVTSLLANQTLINQLQTSYQNLLQVEDQLSTGQAFQYLSQDPSAGVRGVQLQELINEQTQIGTNLSNSSGAMSTADSTLSSVSSLVNSVLSTVETAQGATATATNRQAAASQVQDALQQLVSLGNTQYDGGYLFGGSESTVQPFTMNGDTVTYNGNTGSQDTISNLNQVLQTNVDGNSAFGAISSAVQGVGDLTPDLSLDTTLASLNNGQGVSLGSITISDGTNSSTIDLSNAKTIGDVVNAIQANPPAGDRVEVALGASGLNVQLIDPSGPGSLVISDAGGDTTATDLGIAGNSNTGSISGGNLSPTLNLDTSLNDILGTSSSAILTSSGADNDIEIQAVDHGSALNNTAISFQTDSSLQAGDVVVNYDTSNPSAPTLTFEVSASGATANEVIQALNTSSAGSVFQGSLVTGDTTNSAAAGTGLIDTSLTAVTSGGSGTNLDQTSGLLITSGGTNYAINLSSASTIQDVLNAINDSGAGLTASINAQGTGINVVSKVSGVDFSIGENGGTTATQLGIRSFTTSTQLADLNHGLGVTTSSDVAAAESTSTLADFTIDRPDGTSFDINVSGAQTVGDVINLINNNADNQTPANKITAQLNATGNGIELTSNDVSSPGAFQVVADNGSQAAIDLGLIPSGQTTSAAAVNTGSQQVISGDDTNPQEVDGMFNSLAKLYTALQTDDTTEISRDVGMLQGNLTQLNYAQSELGSREQYLQSAQTTNSNNLTTLKSDYSNTVDVDMTTAATNLTQDQLTYQATLQATALMSQVSLLEYL